MGTETVMEPQCTGKVGEDCHDETITKCQDISIKNVINASPSLRYSDTQEPICHYKCGKIQYLFRFRYKT